MSDLPVFGAGIWHFATYVDRYATEGYGEPGRPAGADRQGRRRRRPLRRRPQLAVRRLRRHARRRPGGAGAQQPARGRHHPGDLQQDYVKGSITNPDPAVRAKALDAADEATELAKELGCDYVKLWFGQDGWDYPFQVTTTTSGSWPSTGCASCVSAHPDIKFVIEYKPREPREQDHLPERGPDPAGHPADRLRQPRHPARLRALPVRAGDPGRRRPALHRRRQVVRHRRQRQLPRLGRRHGRRLGAPGRDVRVLPHPAHEQLGRRLAARPVPVPGGQRAGREAGHRLPQGASTARWTRSTRTRWPPPRPTTTRWPPNGWSDRSCSSSMTDGRSSRRTDERPDRRTHDHAGTRPARRRTRPATSRSPTSPRPPGRSGSRTSSWSTTPAPGTSAATSPPSTSSPPSTARC